MIWGHYLGHIITPITSPKNILSSFNNPHFSRLSLSSLKFQKKMFKKSKPKCAASCYQHQSILFSSLTFYVWCFAFKRKKRCSILGMTVSHWSSLFLTFTMLVYVKLLPKEIENKSYYYYVNVRRKLQRKNHLSKKIIRLFSSFNY